MSPAHCRPISIATRNIWRLTTLVPCAVGRACVMACLLLLSSSFGGAFTISWDGSPDPTVRGYRVHYGTSTGGYTTTLDVGKGTSVSISDPPMGVTYYAVVTAYAAASIESLPSQEVSYTKTRKLEAYAGDFNADGQADILWRNPATGRLAFWLSTGTLLGGEWVELGLVATDWAIVGTADFDADGRADILWRDSEGLLVVWFMDGAKYRGWGRIGLIGLEWRIAGTADFDGDGKIDILWRNAEGYVVAWFMDGLKYRGWKDIGPMSLYWTIAGTADFNGDGKADILWRNREGVFVYWLMEDGTFRHWAEGGPVGNEWQIVGTGDFDGDGKTDILWRHENGNVVTWFLNGTTYSGWEYIDNVSRR